MMDEVLAHNKENKSANFGDTSESGQVFPEVTPKSQLIQGDPGLYNLQRPGH